ncbi:AAA family ATPase [Streptomyces sp. NPDC054804]
MRGLYSNSEHLRKASSDRGAVPIAVERGQLLGREAELALIDSLLAGPGRGSSGLLLHGEPGVGKTALLDAAAARATAYGMRVLRAAGSQAEVKIAFSALHQLLYPVRHDVDRLAEHHRDALHQVFDLARSPAPEPLVSTALLALLELTTAERALLLIADDVAWFDEASAAVLGFAVRRIADAPIVFLAASRTGTEDLFRRSGLPERTVESLDTRSAGAVLDACSPGLAPVVRRRLLAEADGNPLALQELPVPLTERQRAGQDPLPDRLPLSRRLAATCAGLLAELPAPTRRLMLLRTGRVEDARAHVRAAQEAGIPRIGPRTELITAGAAAVAADDAEAAALFEAALALPDTTRWPWDYARIQFAYGQWLRRTHDMAGARTQLGAALETFDRIGAEMMAQRAAAELRATGVSVVRPDAAPEQLTAQELQIAELAATGLSNKQIGERLFLSHRTVGSHLYRVYPKLGITSRAALRGALEAMSAAEQDDETP